MINRNFLIILVGLPASGKSTIATILKHIIEKRYENVNVEIIDTDQIRYSINPNKFNYKKEQLVRKKSLNKVKNELKRGSIVISDDLNYYTSMRHDLKQIAENYKKKYFIIHIATPLEKCIEWNKNRGFFIPQEVIFNISKKFDHFDNYNWDSPLISIDPSKSMNLKGELDKLVILIEEKLAIETTRKDPKRNRILKQRNHEKLDKITRDLVRKISQNDEYHPLMKKVSKLRKEFIRKNIDNLIDKTQIKEEFLKFLNKSLNFECS
ncbi:MAG: adenylyl-sulfate kinase [Promethearchaeota archaeon]